MATFTLLHHPLFRCHLTFIERNFTSPLSSPTNLTFALYMNPTRHPIMQLHVSWISIHQPSLYLGHLLCWLLLYCRRPSSPASNFPHTVAQQITRFCWKLLLPPPCPLSRHMQSPGRSVRMQEDIMAGLQNIICSKCLLSALSGE